MASENPKAFISRHSENPTHSSQKNLPFNPFNEDAKITWERSVAMYPELFWG